MTGLLLALLLGAPAPAGLPAAMAACRARYEKLDPGAEACLNEVRAQARAAGDRAIEAESSLCLEWLFLWFGRLADGLREGLLAHQLYQELPESRDSRWADAALGWLLRDTGQPGRSLEVLEHDIARAEKSGDRLLEALTRAFHARTLTWMGLLEEAEPEAQAAVALAEGTVKEDAGVTLISTLWARALLRDEQDRRADAVRDYQRGLELSNAIGFWQLGTIMLENLSEDHLALGELAVAEKEIEQSEAIWRKGNIAFQLGFVAGNRGRLRVKQGRLREAVESFDEMLRLVGHSNWASRDALTSRARALRALHDPRARGAYWDVLKFLEQTREGAGGEQQRAAFLANNQAPFRDLTSVLWEEEGQGAAAEAFAVAEAARARSLLDASLGAGSAAPTALPLAAGAVSSLLGPGAALLEYVEADGELFVFAVDAAGTRWTRLASGAQARELADRARFYRALVEQAGDAADLRAAGARLHGELIAPALRLLPAAPRELVLSPDGALHELPFEALVDEQGSFLAERFTLRYAPSGSFLGRAVGAGGGAPGLAIGDPPSPPGVSVAPAALRAGLGPLPYGRIEAKLAGRAFGGQVLVGADASEARFKREGPDRFRVLHFATHAFVDDVLPLRSALVLGEGDGEDGLLHADEIYRMPLHADLVVLSACSTAAGRVTGSEGVQSLARAFLQAGAQAVLATRWPVGDVDSGALIERFYAHAAALDAPAALRAAQVERIHAGAPPRAWAGFTLTGSAVHLAVRDTGPGPGAIVLAGSAALLLALAVILLWRRRARPVLPPAP